MKLEKKILVAAALLVSLQAQSQILISLLFGDKLNAPGLEFGLDGGVNFSHISGLDSDDYLATFNLGFYFDIRINEPWYINTGLLVKSQLGTNKLSATDLEFLQIEQFAEPGDYSQRLNSFMVPILAKYKFENHFHVLAGLQLGLTHKAWVEYNSDVDGSDARIKDYNRDMINLLDVGLSGGFGYRLLDGKGVTIGLRYYYGFIDVYKDKSGTNNSSLFLNASIPIGAAKQGDKPE